MYKKRILKEQPSNSIYQSIMSLGDMHNGQDNELLRLNKIIDWTTIDFFHNIPEQLIKYVNENIIPKYIKISEADKYHSVMHVFKVALLAIYIAKNISQCEVCAYVMSVYHDLGLLYKFDPEHYELSMDYVANDDFLKTVLSNVDIQNISEAILEQIPNIKRETILGKILHDANMEISPEDVIIKAWFNPKLYSNDYNERFNKIFNYINYTYGDGKFKYDLDFTRNLMSDVCKDIINVVNNVNVARVLYDRMLPWLVTL